MLCVILIIIVRWNDVLYNGTIIKGNTFYELNREIYTNLKLSQQCGKKCRDN
jgi:hypothetical protein